MANIKIWFSTNEESLYKCKQRHHHSTIQLLKLRSPLLSVEEAMPENCWPDSHKEVLQVDAQNIGEVAIIHAKKLDCHDQHHNINLKGIGSD